MADLPPYLVPCSRCGHFVALESGMVGSILVALFSIDFLSCASSRVLNEKGIFFQSAGIQPGFTKFCEHCILLVSQGKLFDDLISAIG